MNSLERGVWLSDTSIACHFPLASHKVSTCLFNNDRTWGDELERDTGRGTYLTGHNIPPWRGPWEVFQQTDGQHVWPVRVQDLRHTFATSVGISLLVKFPLQNLAHLSFVSSRPSLEYPA